MDNTKITSNPFTLKAFISENLLTLFFALIVVLSLMITKDTPYNLLNHLLDNFIGYTVLTLSLLIPIIAGMGFNFGVVIGVLSGNIGVILTLNWGFTGILGLLVAGLTAAATAFISGYILGIILSRATSHKMILSLFIGYLGEYVYQFIFVFLVGAIIPFASHLLLPSGIGMNYSVDLSKTFFNALEGILEIPFFLLLLIAGCVYLMLNIYQYKKETLSINRLNLLLRFILPTITVVFCGMIVFLNHLPFELGQLKTIDFPIISGVIILLVIIVHHLILKGKIGKEFLSVHQNSLTPQTSHNVTKIRTKAIVFSTILAALGQIIFLQNTGILVVYGSYHGIGLYLVTILVLGGATYNKVKLRHVLIGSLLLHSFNSITLPVLGQLFENNLSGVFRMLVLNGILLYAFVTKKNTQLD